MSELIKFSDVRDRVVRLRDQDVLLDADVAQLYGVETKEVNKAVRNNPDKFPDGYIFELQQSEKQYVVENFHHLARFEKIARIGVESVSDFAAEIERFKQHIVVYTTNQLKYGNNHYYPRSCNAGVRHPANHSIF